MTKPKQNVGLPWLDINLERDAAVGRVVGEFIKSKKRGKHNKPKLTPPEERQLAQDMKNAELGRSKGGRLLHTFGDTINVENAQTASKVAPMKDWDRAAEKMHSDRDLFDLGRGRLGIKRISEAIKADDILSKPNLLDMVKDVTILPQSVKNYLRDPRESGFAGFINFDCLIDLGKGREGRFEVQIMPEDYYVVDRHSHRLYEMIRIIQDVPKAWQQDEDKKVEWALVTANRALFVEHGLRSRFIGLREDHWQLSISPEDAKEIFDILDRIQNRIQATPGRHYGWMKETEEAITFAKTSVQNIANSDPRQMLRAYRDIRRKEGLDR